MNPEILLSQLASLELKLAVLKAQIKQHAGTSSRKTAAELYGLCSGQSSTTEEDLKTVRFSVGWRDSPGEAGSL